MTTDRAYLSEGETARYLSMSVAWLRRRRLQRLPPAWAKLGRSVRYHVSDVDEYARSRRVPVREAQ
ncbi:MAG: helix-turn-helix domain-containing protein, partial [Acidobacteriota bacterium]